MMTYFEVGLDPVKLPSEELRGVSQFHDIKGQKLVQFSHLVPSFLPGVDQS